MSSENSFESAAPIFTNNWFDVTARQIWDTLIPQINPTTILEIGSFEGASACYLIEKCASKAPVEIHCVDTWAGGIEHQKAGAKMTEVERRFLDNTKLAREKVPHPVNLVVHKGLSSTCLAEILSQGLLNYFDLIYVDGSHQAADVLSDAVFSFPLLKNGGVMVFDDYLYGRNSPNPLDGPKRAVDAFLDVYFQKMKIMWSPNSQVVAKKVSD